MFIAFEGPDNTGKSTSAAELDAAGQPTHDVSKAVYEEDVEYRRGQSRDELMLPTVYDRINWLTHTVYRLAMPNHEWNDARVRTVYAMPDTHLIVKLHTTTTVAYIWDELYGTGRLKEVNELYRQFVMDFLVPGNHDQRWFKSISIMEVENTPEGFKQSLVFHQNGMHFRGYYDRVLPLMVNSNQDLLEFLYDQDRQL